MSTKNLQLIGSAVVTDETLTQSGIAADARATGDAINAIITDAECEELLSSLNETPEVDDTYKSLLESIVTRQTEIENTQATLNNNLSNLYYQPGDTLNFRLWTAGMLTGSKKLVRFVLPISKPCSNVTNILCTNIECKVRQEDSYIFGSSSEYGMPEALVFTQSENHISVEITIPAVETAINNDAVAIALNCTLVLE